MAEQRIKLNKMRKLIGENMRQSTRNNPRTAGSVQLDFTELLELKAELAENGHKVSDTAFFVWAIAAALQGHPNLNSRLEGDEMVLYDSINPGIAVDTPKGLVSLTLRNTEYKTLLEISESFRDLMRRMKEGRLTMDDYTGSTYTISNMTRSAVPFFTSIINNNECFIIGFGGIHMAPVALDDGTVAVRKVCYMTINANHVLVDGMETDYFTEKLCQILTHPRTYFEKEQH